MVCEMTLDEFYEELRNLKDVLDPTFRDAIRFYMKDRNGDFNSYCPLTAVCYRKTGANFSVASFREAAKELGLQEHTQSIQQAADYNISVLHNNLKSKDKEKAKGIRATMFLCLDKSKDWL